MNKTIEEQVKDIKHCAECSIHSIKNHKLPWLPDDGSFDNVINNMHNAQNKDKLSKAYYEYINLCICNGYSDGEIISGIMQNEEQNKKFDVNIDSVIESLIDIKYTSVKLSESDEKPVKNCNNANSGTDEGSNKSAGGVKINDKIKKKIEGKLKYLKTLSDKLLSNQSDDGDIDKIRSISKELKGMILSIDPTSCNEQEISNLNDISVAVDNIIKSMDNLSNVVNDVSNKQETVTSVQQSEAAHTENIGFNISNFIKQNQPPVKGPNMPVNNEQKASQQPKQTAFPHQICGLTDEQIVEEVGKHFKVMENLPAYALYDLANNKILARKMKEMDAKQRPNNPYLTQVNINEYIDVPELLEKYTLCFTMPCNDKKQVIVVLFNPTPVPGKNGVLNYPLHILKAAKNVNK